MEPEDNTTRRFWASKTRESTPEISKKKVSTKKGSTKKAPSKKSSSKKQLIKKNPIKKVSTKTNGGLIPTPSSMYGKGDPNHPSSEEVRKRKNKSIELDSYQRQKKQRVVTDSPDSKDSTSSQNNKIKPYKHTGTTTSTTTRGGILGDGDTAKLGLSNAGTSTHLNVFTPVSTSESATLPASTGYTPDTPGVNNDPGSQLLSEQSKVNRYRRIIVQRLFDELFEKVNNSLSSMESSQHSQTESDSNTATGNPASMSGVSVEESTKIHRTFLHSIGLEPMRSGTPTVPKDTKRHNTVERLVNEPLDADLTRGGESRTEEGRGEPECVRLDEESVEMDVGIFQHRGQNDAGEVEQGRGEDQWENEVGGGSVQEVETTSDSNRSVTDASVRSKGEIIEEREECMDSPRVEVDEHIRNTFIVHDKKGVDTRGDQSKRPEIPSRVTETGGWSQNVKGYIMGTTTIEKTKDGENWQRTQSKSRDKIVPNNTQTTSNESPITAQVGVLEDVLF